MNTIIEFFKSQSEYKALIQARRGGAYERVRPLLAAGLCEGARLAFIAALLSEDDKKPLLAIVPDEKEAMKLYAALCEYGFKSEIYPGRDFSFHNITCSHEYEQQRLGVLVGIADKTLDCVIAAPDAALQYTMPRGVLSLSRRRIAKGDTVELTGLTSHLISCGYRRVDMVDGVGQFAVRGGIVDIFTPGEANPSRFELFGDEVDSVCIFDVITQRRIEEVREISVSPVREVLPDASSVDYINNVIASQYKRAKREDVAQLLQGELDTLKDTPIPDFIDKYISIVYPEHDCLLDWFRDGTEYNPVVCVNPSGIQDRIKSSSELMAQNVGALIETGAINGKYAAYSATLEDYDYFVTSCASVTLDTFANNPGGRYGGLFTFKTQTPIAYQDSYELLRDDVSSMVNTKYAVILLCENEPVGKNLSGLLEESGIVAPVVSFEDFTTPYTSLWGRAVILYGCAASGFIAQTSRFAVVSLFKNQSLYSRAALRKRSVRAKKSSARERIMSYADLEVGDYVVHDTHGIGVFAGLQTLVGCDGCSRDFLRVNYADSGVVYVPCERLDVLSKYIGAKSSDGTVKLNKIGGTDWGKAKTRVKKAVADMAKELIRLYAMRMKKEGITYSPDDDMQRQFEATFEYEETDGQLAATEEIKKDMTSPHPMDRLLCGDVGFGKTEVALRAAFKAVSDGYQVAILVPTTILAMQHYQTLLSRMRGFAVHVDMLSRFRTPKQQAESLRRLKRGDTDIIVGTHRLISKDVEFNKLGLIIIDEEQRFGVAHKEKLKQISTRADVLTLTATPIPRTLNMAISGIRDMSILDEAPGDRLPPQTYVLEYDELVIGEAMNRELRRGGQVFYLFNNVENIELTVARVRKMCPTANIAFAHGKMEKDELSDIWRDVVEGNTDILVCTTIIETGVDVPNANTLIIENADKMGLSQLHQLRGRIGRSSRRSYAYLTYRKNKVLSKIAEKRLEAIREYTEFGAGFKIALRDLEIRGTGNVLGAEQHGHMDTVGYDMYIKLLNEAVLEESGQKQPEEKECTVALTVSAYLPENYIKSANLRIEMYKKISHIKSDSDLDDISAELLDRFGEPPVYADNLLLVSYIHALGVKLGVRRIEQRENTIYIYPYEMKPEIWVRLLGGEEGRFSLRPGSSPNVMYRIKKGDKPLMKLVDALNKAAAGETLNAPEAR